jgi:hypothetical protein
MKIPSTFRHRLMRGVQLLGLDSFSHGRVQAQGAVAPVNPFEQTDAILAGQGLFLVADQGISTAVESPVEIWADRRGIIGRQAEQTGASSLRPTLKEVGGKKILRFDGTDDRMAFDAHAGILDEACTIFVGVPDSTELGTPVRTLLCVATTLSATARQKHINLGGATSVTRYRALSHNGTSQAALDLRALLNNPHPRPWNVVIRDTGFDGVWGAGAVEPPLSFASIAAPSDGANLWTLGTIGARRANTPISTLQFFEGDVRFILLIPFALTDPQLATVTAELLNAGYLT